MNVTDVISKIDHTVLLAELISSFHGDVSGDSISVWNWTIGLHWSNLCRENRRVNMRNTYKQMEMLEVKQNDRKHTQSMAVIDGPLEFDQIAGI